MLQDLALERASDIVYLRREVVREALPPMPLLPESSFHVYVSDHNVGIPSFMKLLTDYHTSRLASEHLSQRSRRSLLPSSYVQQKHSRPLRITSDHAQMLQAAHFLCYLNADTHTSDAVTDQFHGDLERALRAGMHILLVHETRVEANGAPFKAIIDATPDELKWDSISSAKRLYKELAVMIAGSTSVSGRGHLNVGLHLLLSAISTLPKARPKVEGQKVKGEATGAESSEIEMGAITQSRIEAELPSVLARRGSQLPPGRERRPSHSQLSPDQTRQSSPASAMGKQQLPLDSLTLDSATFQSEMTRRPTERRLTFMMDHRRASSLGCMKDAPGRMNSSRELSLRSSQCAAEPSASANAEATSHPDESTSATCDGDHHERTQQFRLAKLRRSSSREEALARKNSLSATSRPERTFLRACTQMPGQAFRVVQSGVDILQTRATALASRSQEVVADPVTRREGEGQKVEDLEAMIHALQAQLIAKEQALAMANDQLTGPGRPPGATQEIEQQCEAGSSTQLPAVRRESLSQARRKTLVREARRGSPAGLPKPTSLPRPTRDELAVGSTREPESAHPSAGTVLTSAKGSRAQHVPTQLMQRERAPRSERERCGHGQQAASVSQRNFYL